MYKYILITKQSMPNEYITIRVTAYSSLSFVFSSCLDSCFSSSSSFFSSFFFLLRKLSSPNTFLMILPNSPGSTWSGDTIAKLLVVMLWMGPNASAATVQAAMITVRKRVMFMISYQGK